MVALHSVDGVKSKNESDVETMKQHLRVNWVIQMTICRNGYVDELLPCNCWKKLMEGYPKPLTKVIQF